MFGPRRRPWGGFYRPGFGFGGGLGDGWFLPFTTGALTGALLTRPYPYYQYPYPPYYYY